MSERPISHVPRPVFGLLAAGLLLQVAFQALTPLPRADADRLPAPPREASLRLAGLDEPVVLAKLLMLWLQAFDNQPGISVPFRELDYDKLAAWLDRIIALDPAGQYPLLAASRLYAEVPDPARQRHMLALVSRHFPDDPARRWPWLAHAVILAKHRLNDLPLARRFAAQLRTHASDQRIPDWVRDLEIAVLEDLGELESARMLIGGLIYDGRISDPRELAFLRQRLEKLENRPSKK